MKSSFCTALRLMLLLAIAPALGAQTLPKGTKSGFVNTADGVKIHYLDIGKVQSTGNFQVGGTPPPGALTNGQVSFSNFHQQPSLLFIPGWTMPAWIWEKQIEHFSKTTRVVAMDPRSQGESTKTPDGLYPDARAKDIKAVVDQLKLAPVVLVGWSMGVSELASYVNEFGNEGIAGIVLVDGIAGLDDQMGVGMVKFAGGMQKDRAARADAFVRSMYKKPQSEEYLKRVIAVSLETPTADAVALLLGTISTDNRPNLGKIARPTLLVVTKGPLDTLYLDIQGRIPGARLEHFEDAGHALFVDDADRFNALLDQFLASLAQPARATP